MNDRYVKHIGKWALLPVLLLLLAGCEAPLNLERVAEEQRRSTHAFDQFKAVAATASHVVAASDAGVLLISDSAGEEWRRVQMPTKASFLNAAACANGRFVLVDSRRTLWVSDDKAASWQPMPVQTEESLMGLACDRNNRIWLGASFSTLLSSDDFGASWASTTQDEDLQFTVIQTLDDGLTVAAGEFGTVMFSKDGGDWERAEPMPNEFYPMGLYFRDRQTGWVSGLSGTILHTADGGNSWQRQDSGTGVPLYNFTAAGERLFVMGDNGTLLELADGGWQPVAGLPLIAPYLIGAAPVGEQRLVVAGGAGTLMHVDLIPETGRVAEQGAKQ